MQPERWIRKEMDEAELWEVPGGYVMVALRSGKVLGVSGRSMQPLTFREISVLDYYPGAFAGEVEAARSAGLDGWKLRAEFGIHQVMNARQLEHMDWVQKVLLPLGAFGAAIVAIWLWA